jgi:hypothetical protein
LKTLIAKDSGLPMMGRRFSRIVEECLHRLDRGENLPDVLADFPAEAEQLKPLLLVAMASRSMTIPIPSQAAQRLGRNHMLSAMDSINPPAVTRKTPLYRRARQWSTRLVNNLRAQFLIRPAPSYRLAIIALVVIFGSGIFALSASASPADLLTAFAADFQGVMGLFDGGASDDSPNYFNLFTIFSENYSLFAGKQAAKVAFQLDFSEDSDHPGLTKHMAGSGSSQSGPNNHGSDPGGGDPDPQGPPAGIPTYPPGQYPGEDDDTPPAPFPGNAVNVVNEVVSDTAKEKNPVWDQLPFNQTDSETSDGDEDQGDVDLPDEDDDEDKDDCQVDDDTGQVICDNDDDDDDDDDDEDKVDKVKKDKKIKDN